MGSNSTPILSLRSETLSESVLARQASIAASSSPLNPQQAQVDGWVKRFVLIGADPRQ